MRFARHLLTILAVGALLSGCLIRPPEDMLAGELRPAEGALWVPNPETDDVFLWCRSGDEVLRAPVIYPGPGAESGTYELVLTPGNRYTCWFSAVSEGKEIFLGFLAPLAGGCGGASSRRTVPWGGTSRWAGVTEFDGFEACPAGDVVGEPVNEEDPPFGVFCGTVLVEYGFNAQTADVVGASFLACIGFQPPVDGGTVTAEAGFYFGYSPGSEEAIGCPLGTPTSAVLPFEAADGTVSISTLVEGSSFVDTGAFLVSMFSARNEQGVVDRLEGLMALVEVGGVEGFVMTTSGGLFLVEDLDNVPTRLRAAPCGG